MVSHFASVSNLCHVAGSFNGSCHGNEKPVPAALGTKTKLRGGGGERKGGEGEASLAGARVRAGWILTGRTPAEATVSPALSLGDTKETRH